MEIETVRIRLGRKVYEAGPMRVRDFIELTLASLELAEIGTDVKKTLDGHKALIKALEGLVKPRPRFEEINVVRLRALATYLTFKLMGPPDPEDARKKREDSSASKPEKLKKRSWEELAAPAFRTARLVGMKPDQVLDMPLIEYNRLEKTAEAMWAGFQLDLLKLIDHPHLKQEHASRVARSLRETITSLAPEDASEWRDHIAEARRLLT